ncbi:WSSV249 [White spot syndrome virus]|uniref:WSSV249 n=1 Tax=White spot syndrome virus TaxID=342409 RepID=A0A2I6SBX9_9VIRU|nr:WSSV249 [White spot syndrome virus]
MQGTWASVSADLDAEFAAEMRETYPDAALEQNLKDLDKFEETIPESQVKKLKKIDSYLTENPERAGKELTTLNCQRLQIQYWGRN